MVWKYWEAPWFSVKLDFMWAGAQVKVLCVEGANSWGKQDSQRDLQVHSWGYL